MIALKLLKVYYHFPNEQPSISTHRPIPPHVRVYCAAQNLLSRLDFSALFGVFSVLFAGACLAPAIISMEHIASAVFPDSFRPDPEDDTITNGEVNVDYLLDVVERQRRQIREQAELIMKLKTE